MRLIATVPCRNEAWVLRASIPAMLRWCDAAVILDHASTDDTPDVLGWLAVQYPGRVHRLEERDPTWREATYRQRTLDKARELGATHVATVDADEILTGNAIDNVRGVIETLPHNRFLHIPWLMLWGSLDSVRAGDTSVWSSARAPVAFLVTPDLKYTDGEYDIHARVPVGMSGRSWLAPEVGGLMHLQHASRRRLRAKQALYKMTEVLRWGKSAAEINRRYGPTTDETGMKLEPVPAEWWGPEKASVSVDAEPWQEAEVRKLLELHGHQRFAGLDLCGL